MVIKRPIQCGECRKYVDLYIAENKNLKDILVTCTCGNKQICIKDHGGISKWRVIE